MKEKTLRDEMAMAALSAVIRAVGDVEFCDTIAKAAYQIADAMMDQREKGSRSSIEWFKAGDGWRFLNEGETLVRGDEVLYHLNTEGWRFEWTPILNMSLGYVIGRSSHHKCTYRRREPPIPEHEQ